MQELLDSCHELEDISELCVCKADELSIRRLLKNKREGECSVPRRIKREQKKKSLCVVPGCSSASESVCGLPHSRESVVFVSVKFQKMSTMREVYCFVDSTIVWCIGITILMMILHVGCVVLHLDLDLSFQRRNLNQTCTQTHDLFSELLSAPLIESAHFH